MAINSGPRAAARHWSRAVYEAFPNIHGLRYASSTHANQPCYAFYDRAASLLNSQPSVDLKLSLLELGPLLEHAADALGYDLT